MSELTELESWKADAIRLLGEKVKAEKERDRAVDALRPFAALAAHFPTVRKYGNRPTTGDIFSCDSGKESVASITVEDLHKAANLIAEIERG